LFPVGQFLKIFSETILPNKATFYGKVLWEVGGLLRFPHFIPIGQKTWSPWEILVSDWLKFKKIFSSDTRRHKELLLCRNYVWEILYKLTYFVLIIQVNMVHRQFLLVMGQLKKIFSKTI
jgi:hypothetical protein